MIGLRLSPKVRYVVHPKSQEAGIPDLALFSADQIPARGEPLPGVIPSRGIIEEKGTSEGIDKIAALHPIVILTRNLQESDSRRYATLRG